MYGFHADDRTLAGAMTYAQSATLILFALLDDFCLKADQFGRGANWAIRQLLAESERIPG